MDGEDSGGVCPARPALFVQHDWQESGVPVIAMDNVGNPIQSLANIEGGTTKKQMGVAARLVEMLTVGGIWEPFVGTDKRESDTTVVEV